MEKEIKELQDKLDALKLKYEQSKQPFKDGDVVNKIGTNIFVKITDFKGARGYGVDGCGVGSGNDFWSFKGPREWQLATDKEWLDVCIKEAEKRGFKENTEQFIDFKFITTGYKDTIRGGKFYHTIKNEFCIGGRIIMKGGIWATVIAKDKTLYELFNNGIKSSIIIYEEILANPEAFIKAINNLDNQK